MSVSAVTATTQRSCRLSIVIPLFNEDKNSSDLLRELHEALGTYPHPWELILVNDGSTDATGDTVRSLLPLYGPHIRLVALSRRYGQTAAMQAGIDFARGDVIVTMDGDLQYYPSSIPLLVDRLLSENLDLVVGWRKRRKDTLLLRNVPSRIANAVIGRLTGLRLHDVGCSLKAYRARVVKGIRLQGEMHRFIPAWVATHTLPSQIQEQVVDHRPRLHGNSKYGLGRIFRVPFDMLVVIFFLRFGPRPAHLFGAISLVVGTLGAALLSYLVVLKLLGFSIGHRPLLPLGVLLCIMSAQFFSTGIICELLTRLYYDGSPVNSYSVGSVESCEINGSSDADSWHHHHGRLPTGPNDECTSRTTVPSPLRLPS